MAFVLENVVPWGRNLEEYKEMFLLSKTDLLKNIAGFADGPASFNCEATAAGSHITSLDPIYQFSREQLHRRIMETKEIVLEQTLKNAERYHWDRIKNIEELGSLRMQTMEHFLEDFDEGKNQGRYVNHEFPARTAYSDNTFELGLCSHFLLLYPSLGLDFHIRTIDEMLRICQEVRISPAVDLDGVPPAFLDELLERYRVKFHIEIMTTSYAFLKTENQFLRIKKNSSL